MLYVECGDEGEGEDEDEGEGEGEGEGEAEGSSPKLVAGRLERVLLLGEG